MGFGLKGIATQIRMWLSDGVAAPVSGANEVTFRYNTGLQRPEFSTNTGPYLPFASGSGVVIVANVAALGAYDDTPLDDSTPAWVGTLLCDWLIDRASTAVPDGITVVACNSGVGNWHRGEPSRSWAYQTAWVIDQALGDDENYGGAAAPLATHDELVRRIGTELGRGAAVIGVAFVGNYAGNLDWNGCSAWDDVTLIYQGVRTILYSGSVTGAVPYDAPTGAVGTITDAAIPASWTASGLVGKAIVMTNGATAGYVGWIEKDLGAKTANYQQPTDAVTLAQGDPVVPQTFDIVDLTIVAGFIRVGGPMTVIANDLHLQGGGGAVDVVVAEAGSSLTLNTCQISGGICSANGAGTLDLVACRADSTVVEVVSRSGSTVEIVGCALECKLLGEGVASPSGTGGIVISRNSTSWNKGATSSVGEGNVSILATYWWGAFDFPAASVGITVDLGQVANLVGRFWGSGNLGDYGLVAGATGTIRYQTLPTFGPNALAACNITGLLCAYADLPVVVPVKTAGIVAL
jgi:hypothetical protein